MSSQFIFKPTHVVYIPLNYPRFWDNKMRYQKTRIKFQDYAPMFFRKRGHGLREETFRYCPIKHNAVITQRFKKYA